jgi:PA14 domain/Right handed beta helix region
VQGFQIFAATVITGDPQNPAAATSSHVVLDGIHLRYPSHYTLARPTNPGDPWGAGLESGVMLFGQNQTLKNSSIAFSAGNGVVMGGQGHTVENNVIHDVAYAMNDAGAIFTGLPGTNSSGHRITGNTLYGTGRSVIVHRYTQATAITHNHLYNGGLLTNDLGMTYTFQSDGGGSEIAYNIVHDNFAPSESMGIYLDNGSKNYVVHHNIVYNVRNALNLNLPSINNKVYNNTLLGWNESVGGGAARSADCDASGTELVNNIFNNGLNFGGVFNGTRCPAGTGIPGDTNNLTSSVNPRFADLAGDNYSLQSGSPALDTGRVLEPYTQAFSGSAPDLGALESGSAPFQAGATLNLPCVYGDDCTPKPARRYGVKAEYFSDENLRTLAWTRIDPNLEFSAGDTAAPAGTFMPSGKNYSARWTGFVTAPVTGSYTFTVTADDGGRFWLDGQPLINRLEYKDPPEDSASVNLQAGARYSLKLEMHQGSGGAAAKLEWAYPGQPRVLVPRRALEPQ